MSSFLFPHLIVKFKKKNSRSESASRLFRSKGYAVSDYHAQTSLPCAKQVNENTICMLFVRMCVTVASKIRDFCNSRRSPTRVSRI